MHSIYKIECKLKSVFLTTEPLYGNQENCHFSKN